MTRTRVLGVLALLLIIVVGLIGRTSRRDTPAPVAAPTVTLSGTTPGQTTTVTTSIPGTPTASASEAEPGDPGKIASAFVTAWVSRTARDTAGTWVARMRPYASEPLLAQLAQAAPDAVEAHRVTGPVTVLNSGLYGAQVTVPVDAGPTPLVGLSSTGDRWLVTSLSALPPGSS